MIEHINQDLVRPYQALEAPFSLAEETALIAVQSEEGVGVFVS